MNEPEPVVLNGQTGDQLVSNDNIMLIMDPERVESKEDDYSHNSIDSMVNEELSSEDTISKNQDSNQKQYFLQM